jgi:hypothetical protein
MLREIERRGPSRVGDFAAHENRKGGWWGWSDAKSAPEWLIWMVILDRAGHNDDAPHHV